MLTKVFGDKDTVIISLKKIFKIKIVEFIMQTIVISWKLLLSEVRLHGRDMEAKSQSPKPKL